MQYYYVPGAAEDDDICGPGIKTRLARSRADPPDFVHDFMSASAEALLN